MMAGVWVPSKRESVAEAQAAELAGLWWHGTSEQTWDKIQTEGVLWGYPCPRCLQQCSECRRYTYLTPHKAVAAPYGEVLLRVQYRPVGIDGTATDNYGFDPPPGQTCWQFSVFVPIPLAQVSRWQKPNSIAS